ncbi:polysaccharide deacetylase family protein [Methylobacterium sp. C25]|uniref:polysaccharide deacetylase family protein n=1 Tax=Methylobacterium sp. C25 TaxID=2721622 RepID=UPI001F2ACADC|nr:polysaccharide deacetylase family protein [Methylobacterium sp. C25]MCE4225051.1 polysaccharide deacetylase family protein [Methylobacterium sp. C25]
MRTRPGTFIFNFHGIGKISRPYDPGEAPFWLSQQEFKEALDAIELKPSDLQVAITFDDGNVSDLEIAAPELIRRNIPAAFFALAGRLGQASFLSKTHLRELTDAGFEIGSHGYDHVDWTRLRRRDLEREACASKAVLEDTIGVAVRRAAIPFGRYNWRVLRALERAGYTEVLSSDGGPRLSSAWPVPRRSLRDGRAVSSVSDLLAGGHAVGRRATCEARLVVKASSPMRAPPNGFLGGWMLGR